MSVPLGYFFLFLQRDYGHWLVRDYLPFRHQIFAPNSRGRVIRYTR